MLLGALLAVPAAAAAGSVSSGQYTVRDSAVNSEKIPAAIARANDIQRSGDTALVMITLQQPGPDAPLNAVPANVSGHARDLMGNRTALAFNRVEAAGSVYSLAQMPIKDDQTVTVVLEVSPVEGRHVIPVTFTQTFFTR